MKVRAIDSDGDWTFGQGLANYLKDEEAIKQNVVTRLKSFKNDWFLDVEAEIDWFNLLGQKNTKQDILNEVERVTLNTEGVARVDSLDAIVENRNVTILLQYTTIYNNQTIEKVTL